MALSGACCQTSFLLALLLLGRRGSDYGRLTASDIGVLVLARNTSRRFATLLLQLDQMGFIGAGGMALYVGRLPDAADAQPTINSRPFSHARLVEKNHSAAC